MPDFQHNLISILYTIREMASSQLIRVLDEEGSKMPEGGREQIQSVLDRISLQAGRALEITKRLGSSLKPQKEGRKKRSKVSIRWAWKKVIKILQREFPMQTMEMIERIPHRFPPVICERNECYEILYHLARNAVQAMASMPAAPPAPKLILRAQIGFNVKEDPCAIISLSDTGPGIPQDNLKYLFRPFFTTKPEAEGNGLGLYLTQELVGKNNGKIAVSSFPGAGATFTLEFPVSSAHEAACR